MTKTKTKLGIVLGKIVKVNYEAINETTEETAMGGKWKAAFCSLTQVIAVVSRLVFWMF